MPKKDDSLALAFLIWIGFLLAMSGWVVIIIKSALVRKWEKFANFLVNCASWNFDNLIFEGEYVVKQHPQPKKTFLVEVQMEINGKPRNFSKTFETDALDKLLGRYLRLYGVPIDMGDHTMGYYQWHERDKRTGELTEIDLFFMDNTGQVKPGDKIIELNKSGSFAKTEPPVVTSPVSNPNQDVTLTSAALESMVKAEVLTKVS